MIKLHVDKLSRYIIYRDNFNTTYRDITFSITLPKIKKFEISPQISLLKCVYMTSTL